MESSQIAHSFKGHDSEPYIVSSSLSDLEESDGVAPRKVTRGLFPSYSRVFQSVPTTIQVVTVTSTTTSFSLIASAIKKPVAIASLTLVPEVDAVESSKTYGGALCLPPGYVVC